MPPRRILVFAEGQLGDLLLLTPALRSLKVSFPSSHLAVLVVHRRRYAPADRTPGALFGPAQGGTSEVLTRLPAVSEVWDLDRTALRALHGSNRIAAEWSIVSWMRQRRFDTAICTFPQDRFVLWAAASGARVRVGEAGQRFARLLNHRPAIAKDRGGVRRYYADLVSAVGAEVTDMHTEFSPSDGARRWAEEALGTAGEAGKGRIVAVHPGASGKFRVWPPERFSAVIDALHEEGRWTPVLVGSAFDREAMDRVADATRAPLLRVDCGESVDRLAALLAGCALLVSNDSGPRHLAIAVGVRSVACFPLFTDAAWKNYGEEEGSWIVQGIPPCPACSGNRCEDRIPDGAAFGSTCMRMIRAEDVLRRVRVVLGGG